MLQHLNKIQKDKCILQKRHRFVINVTKNISEYKANDEKSNDEKSDDENKNDTSDDNINGIQFDEMKIDPPKPFSTGTWSEKNKKQWFTYDEPKTPMTQQDIKNINKYLPSEMMTKFMTDNKQ